MSTPKVTIIMATYNRAHFIVETLQSIISQSYECWECLIIDDGGTDNTKETIASILDNDKRFEFFHRPDTYRKGLPGCRNYGLDLSKGDYIIFFDDDDIVHPQNLELCVKELSRENVSFCRYLRSVFFENFDYKFEYSSEYDSFYIDVYDLERMLKNELPFNSCTVMWKKECFMTNRFIEHLMYAEEWELYSRILSAGFKGISIEKFLFYGRKHPNSNTGEYYLNNPVRRQSSKEAILLVVKNLYEKGLLSDSLVRYFVVMSYRYQQYNLFAELMKVFQFSGFLYFKWRLFFFVLPFKLKIMKLKKSIKK